MPDAVWWKTGYSYSVDPLAEMLRVLWQKTYTILIAYMYELFSYCYNYDPSLWWLLLLSMAAIIGQAQASCII